MDSNNFKGIALDEYNKTTPPGWAKFIHNYPLPLFIEKFDAWKRQTSLIEADLESNAHTSDGEGDEGFDDPLFYM